MTASRKNKSRGRIVTLLWMILLSLTACATSSLKPVDEDDFQPEEGQRRFQREIYSPVTEPHIMLPESFAVDLPQGWRQHDLWADPYWLKNYTAMLEKRRKLTWDVIRLTHDGLLLQQICIGRMPVVDELPNTKRELAQDMTPLEAGEMMGDELRSNPYLTNQDMIESAPATVGGYPGFRLHYTYRTEEKLKVEGLYYGAIVGPWLYYMLYEAPAQHYFNKDLQVFDRMLSSVQILKGVS
jgi:hypothetical protein